MGRPSKSSGPVFTSRELALGAGLSLRNFSLLHEQGLAPAAAIGSGGRGGHRIYGSPALAHAALIGALHLAGLDLLVAARLAAAYADEMRHQHGRLFSNIQTYLQSPHNPTPGHRPWTYSADDHTEDDFWVHNKLIDSVVDYRAGKAMVGDMVMVVVDHSYVLTQHHGVNIKIHSPVSGGLPANPDYRIIGRGSSAEIVPITDEVDSLDFSQDPVSTARFQALEIEYLTALENAVARVRINVSLAIRNAFDRIADDRNLPRKAA